MFKELQNALQAANSMLSQLDYWKNSIMDEIDAYNKLDMDGELADWQKEDLELDTSKMELYRNIETAIQKWVKSKV